MNEPFFLPYASLFHKDFQKKEKHSVWSQVLMQLRSGNMILRIIYNSDSQNTFQDLCQNCTEVHHIKMVTYSSFTFHYGLHRKWWQRDFEGKEKKEKEKWLHKILFFVLFWLSIRKQSQMSCCYQSIGVAEYVYFYPDMEDLVLCP